MYPSSSVLSGSVRAIFIFVSVKVTIRLICLCRITTTNIATLSAYHRTHDALLHPHPLPHPHLQLHEIRFRSASGAGVRQLSTGRNCQLTKSHPNHLATDRFLTMTELCANNVLWQLLMLEVEPRVESGMWPPLS